MIYQYIRPCPMLREFVRDYLIAHFVFDKGHPIPFKAYAPKPEQTITFLPRGNLILVNPINATRQVAPSISITGQQLTRYNFHLTSEYLMVRVHFHPGALYRLLGVPLSALTDHWLDGEAIIGSETQRINDRLANCTNYIHMIDIVEHYLKAKILKVKHGHHPLDKVASSVFVDPYRRSLDWLASQSCLCPRQFNRKFVERMGVGPKLYSRIVRFYKAYLYKESNPQADWLTVALFFGYSDYQHMVRDFIEFTNDRPSQWVHQDNESPERRLKLES